MKQEWKLEKGCQAQTSGGKCKVLAVDECRGMVAVQWHDGELGVVRVECVKKPLTERDLWIEVALTRDCAPQEGMLSRKGFCGALYDAGLAKLPD